MKLCLRSFVLEIKSKVRKTDFSADLTVLTKREELEKISLSSLSTKAVIHRQPFDREELFPKVEPKMKEFAARISTILYPENNNDS